MDLTGLLLDEEGTFSLTGFQDFTVSMRPVPSKPLGCGALDWEAVPTPGPGRLGPEGETRV